MLDHELDPGGGPLLGYLSVTYPVATLSSGSSTQGPVFFLLWFVLRLSEWSEAGPCWWIPPNSVRLFLDVRADPAPSIEEKSSTAFLWRVSAGGLPTIRLGVSVIPTVNCKCRTPGPLVGDPVPVSGVRVISAFLGAKHSLPATTVEHRSALTANTVGAS